MAVIIGSGAIERRLAWIEIALRNLNTGVTRMAGELATLQAAVAHETEVVDSAIVLLEGLKAKLDDAIASGDPAALTALSTEIGAETDKLAAAVAANTPAA